MSAPKKVHVAPLDYELRFDGPAMDAAGANGATLPDLALILLAPNNNAVVERETVLHELLHAVWKTADLDRKWPDEPPDGVGEELIDRLAPQLLSLLRNNPRLLSYLTA